MTSASTNSSAGSPAISSARATTPAPFAHLHLHSDYSLLDGANQIPQLVKRVKDLGMDSVALTDHGVMYGSIEFYKECKKQGIKPIVGCEVYISPTTRQERGPKAKSNHLVLLAQNYQGYLNLCRLTSIGFVEGFYRKPRIDHEVLAAHSEGLICLSACLAGEVAQGAIMKSWDAARTAAGRYMDIFGPERFYLEIQDHGIPEQHDLIKGMRNLASEVGAQIVATNDAHYLTGKHAEPHDCLLCIGTAKKKSEENRLKYFSPEFYIKSPDQMAALFSEFSGAVGITSEIASACNCEIPFHQRLYPKYPLPDGAKDARSYLRRVVDEGLRDRYGKIDDKLRAQADFELSIIEKTGFEDYFLVVWDFVKYAREQGIPVGPGRGSGAGSIVAYALRITDVDPIEHGLLFERFLNPERVSAPDFDIDFCFERRAEVIEYVRRKYGDKNVAQIITFGTLKPKAAIRDVGRVLEVPLDRTDQIAKMLPEGPAGPKNLKIALEEIEQFRREYETDPEVKTLIDTARAVEGMHRHQSVHAAGVVIADQELSQLVPVCRQTGSEDLVVQYTMGTVEELGLLKMDFLGLKNLTIIENATKAVKAVEGVEVDWDAIPLHEEDTYKFLARGQTLGIFQLESGGMRDVVKRLKPTEFNDLSAILALYRPGPLEAGMIEDYIARKHGRAEVDCFHPDLEEVLQETYGTIIYQEQVMKIAQIMAGYTLGGADLLRRAMGKKKQEAMDAEYPKFVEGCKAQGHSQELADRLWYIIAKFAGYGFNKSHSVAYAMITFRTAYLMAHYPVCYLAAQLTNEIFGSKPQEKIPHYIAVCKEMGIEVLPPDVNESGFGFTVVKRDAKDGGSDKVKRDRAIRFGLGAIKGVGRGVIEEIVSEVKKDGPFESLQDFCDRVDYKKLNIRTVEGLVKVGAFDNISRNRAALQQALPEMLEMAGQVQREKKSGQENIFGLIDAADGSGANGKKGGGSGAPTLPDVPDWSAMEKLRQEKELIGFYVSGHPLDRWRLDLEAFSTTNSAKLQALMAEVEERGLMQVTKELENGNGRIRNFMALGLVVNVIHKVTKKGQPMAFLEMEDEFGNLEAVIFPRAFEKYRDLLISGRVLAVDGRPDLEGRSPKLLANELMTPETLRRQRLKFLDIELGAEGLDAATLQTISQTVKRHKGTLACRLALRSGGRSVTVQPGKGRLLKLDPNEEAFTALRRLPYDLRLKFALE